MSEHETFSIKISKKASVNEAFDKIKDQMKKERKNYSKIPSFEFLNKEENFDHFVYHYKIKFDVN